VMGACLPRTLAAAVSRAPTVSLPRTAMSQGFKAISDARWLALTVE